MYFVSGRHRMIFTGDEQARRREQIRLADIEAAAASQEEAERTQATRNALRAQADEKTRKNRDKRLKKKLKAASKKGRPLTTGAGSEHPSATQEVGGQEVRGALLPAPKVVENDLD